MSSFLKGALDNTELGHSKDFLGQKYEMCYLARDNFKGKAADDKITFSFKGEQELIVLISGFAKHKKQR